MRPGQRLRQGAVLFHRRVQFHPPLPGQERHPPAGAAGGLPPGGRGAGGAGRAAGAQRRAAGGFRRPGCPGRRGEARRRPALRGDGQRQDPDLSAADLRRPGAGAHRHGAGARDLPHPTAAAHLRRPLRGRHCGAPLLPPGGGAVRRVEAHQKREGPGGDRHPFRRIRPPEKPGADRAGRGAGGHLQVGERAQVPRPGRGQVPLRPERRPAGAGLRHPVGGEHVPRQAGGLPPVHPVSPL